jgi:predicted RNase H-like HicB family nuclease
MNGLKVHYRYPIVVERGGQNCSAFLPDIDGCVTTGATVEETVANMHEALQMHLETMLEDGDIIPPASSIDQIKFDPNTESVHTVEVEL